MELFTAPHGSIHEVSIVPKTVFVFIVGDDMLCL